MRIKLRLTNRFMGIPVYRFSNEKAYYIQCNKMVTVYL